MDEVTVFFDLDATRTYDIKGKKSTEVETNVGRKLRRTFLSGGTKLSPLIIL